MRYLCGLTVALLVVAPVVAQDVPLSEIILPGEGWKKVGGKLESAAGLAVDKEGQLYIADPRGKQILRIDKGGKAEVFTKTEGRVGFITFGKDGKLYGFSFTGFEEKEQPGEVYLVKLDEKGRLSRLASIPDASPLVDVTEDGEVRILLGPPLNVQVEPRAKFIHYDRNGKLKGRTESKVKAAFGLAAVLWPDGGTLVTGDVKEAQLWAYRIQPDGTLAAGEKYYRLARERGKEEAAFFLTIDRQRRVYASTPLGIQVFDPTGRLSGVLASPEREPPGIMAFAGPNRDLLYASFGTSLYVRKLKAQGVPWPEKK